MLEPHYQVSWGAVRAGTHLLHLPHTPLPGLDEAARAGGSRGQECLICLERCPRGVGIGSWYRSSGVSLYSTRWNVKWLKIWVRQVCSNFPNNDVKYFQQYQRGYSSGLAHHGPLRRLRPDPPPQRFQFLVPLSGLPSWFGCEVNISPVNTLLFLNFVLPSHLITKSEEESEEESTPESTARLFVCLWL